MLNLVRRHRLGRRTPNPTQPDPDRGGGLLLTRAGREILIDAYERRMLQPTRGALPEFAGALRRHLFRQAQAVAAWLEGHQPLPVGLSWR